MPIVKGGMTCEYKGCKADYLMTWRDPTIEDRYHGHGLLEVCPACYYELTGHDERGKTLGQVLHELNQQRGR